MVESPPSRPAQSGESPAADYSSTGREKPDTALTEKAVKEAEGAAVSLKNLLRTWKEAIQKGDLAICRSVFSTLVDTANPDTVAMFAGELEKLADRIEAALRAEFAQRVREGDFTAALTLGDKITSLLPDRPIATDFERLKPHLQRRLEKEREEDVGSGAYSKVRA